MKILRTLLNVKSVEMIMLKMMLKSENMVIPLENIEAVLKHIHICNINLKSNQKIPVAFRNLKNHDSHVIMQKLDKFNLKINVIPNGLEKYISFTINIKLSFNDSFQFLISSLDSLVEDLSKGDFKYLSQFDNNVSDLVKQKRFYPYEYISNFEKFKEELPSKEKFYSSLNARKITEKEHEHVLNAWKKYEMKKMRDYHDLYLKCDFCC